MQFDELLQHATRLLEAEGRISYRALKRRLELTDEDLEDLKAELIDAKQLARDENDRVLVWLDPSDADAEVIPASRRQLSVMFCDVVGSTVLSTQLDPEDLRDLLRTYQGICGRIVHEHGGHVAQYLGDGLLVYFGYPKAMEGAGQSAIAAGLAILQEVTQSKALQLTASEQLQVRIGIHTGPVVIGAMGDANHQESLAVGETPNIAARIQGCAEPNQLVISDDTRKVAGPSFSYDDLGATVLKGIQLPVRLWRVHDHEKSQPRAGVDHTIGLVGREGEITTLTQMWAQAEHGKSTYVLLSGEPGVGKSRLVDEFIARNGDSEATPSILQCDPRFSHSPFHPFLPLLAACCDSGSDKAVWPTTVTDVDAHYLDALLGRDVTDTTFVTASPGVRRERTIDALMRWLDGLAVAAPAICVWEDLHTADPSTLELFEQLCAAPSASPMLHLATSRPSDPVDSLHIPAAVRLTLSTLSTEDTVTLAIAAAGENTLAPEVLEYVVATTDGVPLFIEEMTKMLLESDWIHDDGRKYVFSSEHRDVGVPITLQDALLARLDHLPAGSAVAQYAAAIGREFNDDLLVELVAPALHAEGIQQLLHAGLIHRVGSRTTRYRFKHALVSDTAYQSLLKSERRLYHAKIAEAMSRVTPEAIEKQPELVARHWSEAGEPARAAPLWQRAGEQAMRRAANLEALHHLDIGLTALNALPHTAARDQQELALRQVLGPVLITVKGNAATDVELCYERARVLCDELHDDARAFGATFGLRSYHLARADLAQSHAFGERLLEIANAHCDFDEQVEAHVALSNTHFFYGNFAAVQQHVDAGIALYEESMHARHVETYGLDPGVICLSRAAQALWHGGFADRAVREMDKALALAERLDHPFTSAYLYDNAAVLYQWLRDGTSARRWAEAAVALSTQYNFPFFRAWGLIQLGAALAELGHHEDSMTHMDDGIALAEQIGVLLMQPWFLATRAEACLKMKSPEEGLRFVADGLAVVEHTGAVYAAPALNWLQGELLLLSPANHYSQNVEQCLLRSKKIADEHGSIGFGLRAVMTLCRLWKAQGKYAAARELLDSIYRRYSEGFETPDLKDATSLLNELA